MSAILTLVTLGDGRRALVIRDPEVERMLAEILLTLKQLNERKLEKGE